MTRENARWIGWMAAGLGVCLMLLALAPANTAHAGPPGLPSSFFGTVKIDGVNVPLTTTLSAWIDGVKYAESGVSLCLADTVYGLDVPADDLSTPVKEGGVTGDIVTFRIGSRPAQQTAQWRSGVNVLLPLSRLSPGAPFSLTLEAKPSDAVVGQTVALTATVHDRQGQAVEDGTPVTFSATLGVIESPALTANGVATTLLSSTVAGLAHITAQCVTTTATTTIAFVPAAPAQIDARVVPDTLIADSGETAAITVTLLDAFGNGVPGIQVSVVLAPAALGQLDAMSVTNAEGQATGRWIAGDTGNAGALQVVYGSLVAGAPITLENPVPVITAIEPASVTVGSPGFSLTLAGAGFVRVARVVWDGVQQTTTWVSRTRLIATIPAAGVSVSGTIAVRVYTPAPGGGLSNPLTFTVLDRRRCFLPVVRRGPA